MPLLARRRDATAPSRTRRRRGSASGQPPLPRSAWTRLIACTAAAALLQLDGTLITVALPRVKDFRGLKPTSFDGRGNYAMGLKEHIVFPEINYDEIDQIWGMDIIVTTTAKTDEEARQLLREFQFPFTA